MVQAWAGRSSCSPDPGAPGPQQLSSIHGKEEEGHRCPLSQAQRSPLPNSQCTERLRETLQMPSGFSVWQMTFASLSICTRHSSRTPEPEGHERLRICVPRAQLSLDGGLLWAIHTQSQSLALQDRQECTVPEDFQYWGVKWENPCAAPPAMSQKAILCPGPSVPLLPVPFT